MYSVQLVLKIVLRKLFNKLYVESLYLNVCLKNVVVKTFEGAIVIMTC